MSITTPYDQSAVSLSTSEYSLVNNSTTLAAIAQAARISLVLDCANMIAGDQYHVQIKDKAVSGGTQRVIHDFWLTGAQSGDYETAEFPVTWGWDITSTRTAGADRTFSWSIKVDDAFSTNVTQWKGSVPDNLSSGKLPADLKLWLASTPAALSTNGYVQAMLLRWLTDNAGGTPNALASSRVDASVGAYQSGQAPLQPAVAGRTLNVSAGGAGDANTTTWLGSTPNVLQSGRVDSYLGAVASAVIAAGSFAAGSFAAVADIVLDSGAGANAQTLKQIVNVIVSMVAGPGTMPSGDGAIDIKNTAGTKSRVTGSQAGSTRTLTAIDGT